MRRRLLRHALAARVDSATAYTALFGQEPEAFWLDGGVGAHEGMSYMGVGTRTFVSSDSRPSVFNFLREELQKDAIEPDGANPGFALGWVGWLGYELRAETMGVPVTTTSRYPDSALMFIDRALAFDHATGGIELLALSIEWDGALDDWAAEVESILAAAAPRVLLKPDRTSATWRYGDAEYRAMIAECQEAIRAGDAYQLCLTTEATVDRSPDPVDTYLALRAASPSHHGALIRVAGVALLSSSPERFLLVSADGMVESKPIKGTRRRGDTLLDDARLKHELLTSDKELAENLMIVDLMRNDIGRVAELGSVAVTSLQVVESYAQVHQLVSTVRGQLAAGLDAVDAVEACFPAGSMTGAPKRSATIILDRIERRARGIFSGAFGYFGVDGAVDLAMVIRSIVIDANGSTVGAGGGITSLSVPEEELDEVKLKAAALLSVLGVEEATADRSF